MINFVYRNRVKLGLPTFFAGLGSLTGGVIVAHYAGFPQGEIVDYFNWIPRGWLPQTIGQFIAFSGSQLILIGLVLMAWSDKPLTWSKAAYFCFLFCIPGKGKSPLLPICCFLHFALPSISVH